MGLVYSQIILSNPVKGELKPLTVKCLANSGSTYLCIPEHVGAQLGFDISLAQQTREATLADGSVRTMPYIGPIKIGFDNRICYVGALVLGDEVLLSAVPMEDMDLVIQSKLLSLTVNPESPNIARGHAKHIQHSI